MTDSVAATVEHSTRLQVVAEKRVGGHLPDGTTDQISVSFTAKAGHRYTAHGSVPGFSNSTAGTSRTYLLKFGSDVVAAAKLLPDRNSWSYLTAVPVALSGAWRATADGSVTVMVQLAVAGTGDGDWTVNDQNRTLVVIDCGEAP